MERIVFRKIFAGDLFERQETMAISTIINEGCFQTRFDPGNFTFINIGFFLFVAWAFDIQVINTLPINEGNAQLFFLSRVN